MRFQSSIIIAVVVCINFFSGTCNTIHDINTESKSYPRNRVYQQNRHLPDYAQHQDVAQDAENVGSMKNVSSVLGLLFPNMRHLRLNDQRTNKSRHVLLVSFNRNEIQNTKWKSLSTLQDIIEKTQGGKQKIKEHKIDRTDDNNGGERTKWIPISVYALGSLIVCTVCGYGILVFGKYRSRKKASQKYISHDQVYPSTEAASKPPTENDNIYSTFPAVTDAS